MAQFEVKVNYSKLEDQTTITKFGLFVIPAETKEEAITIASASPVIQAFVISMQGTLVSIE